MNDGRARNYFEEWLLFFYAGFSASQHVVVTRFMHDYYSCVFSNRSFFKALCNQAHLSFAKRLY